MRRECCDAAMYQHGHVNYIQSTCRACIVSPVPAMPLRVPPQQQLGAHHSSEMVQWLLIFTGADILLGRVCHAFSCSLLQSSNPMVRPDQQPLLEAKKHSAVLLSTVVYTSPDVNGCHTERLQEAVQLGQRCQAVPCATQLYTLDAARCKVARCT